MGTEIQDFAAALAALKERSGMSYGALAKRLHMSTSTVHRYCNGDAVPHEFAPVERLARLCRAAPDEMVELHRQWILADQAKKQGGARKEQAAPPAPAAPTTPSWARPDDAEAESVADEEAEPVATPTPAVAPVPTPAPASAMATIPAPAAPDADEPLVTGRQGAPGGPGGSTGPGGPGRPWSRRRRVLLAAAVVIALSVPSVLIARNVAGGSDDGRNTDAVGATATAVRNASPSPSPKPSAKPTASPSASASASASATASGPTATAGPAKKGAGAVSSDGVPLRATITSYNWDSPCGQYTLLDDDPNDVPPPPSPQSSRGWAKSLGGVDGGSQLLELTLQGSSSEAVVVSGLHVRVMTRKAPLAWNAFSMADGCGSAITPQSFDIDLDDDQPRTKPVAGQQGDAVVPAQDFPFRTSSTDVQVLNLDAHVEGHDVSWYLELDWTSGDRSGTLRVDDHGEPFRTSSIKARPEYIYWQDRAQWMDKDYSDPSMADEGE
ncbi:helix-turn-helix domain-containing protein [Streptomyces sp. NBC_00247]|uniref:helix-turn-helix domain-containing protein n=1 Tax=Streptomyces sp. NBC_00247 TaxID=2975689 RepID=UPI002E2CC25A|nr:helix-turn-helix domain-containing protein [Streptomyces sp. NBC_00247]